ncbi:hypothetical protein [Nesterenkonia suensis]
MFTPISTAFSTPTQSMTTAPRRLAAGSLPLLAASFALTACTEAEPEVVTETVTEPVTEEVEVEVEVEPEDLEEQREAADERDEELDTREAELEEWAEELEELEGELETREEDVSATELEIEENTIPGSGVYLVGEDIQPGTYRMNLEGDRSCYWARLSGLSGELNDIITNDNVSGQGFVTIAESDVAFETSRCSEWVRQ